MSSNSSPTAPRESTPATHPQQQQQHFLRTTSSVSDFRVHSQGPSDFMISSNPPNPRTSFRLGDWMCVCLSYLFFLPFPFPVIFCVYFLSFLVVRDPETLSETSD